MIPLNIIKRIIEKNDTRLGRLFDLTSQFLIINSLIMFSFETVPSLSKGELALLNIAELITVAFFTIEYVCRILIADHKLKFVFSFYGIIDLLAVLPFYLSFGIDLSSIRIVRLFRLFRVFKLLRYNTAIHKFKRAFKTMKEEMILFWIAASILLYLSSVGIYYCEHEAQPEAFKSIFHCLWWSIVTLTTVGYGDMYPITVGGKIFTSIIALLGIGVVAIPTGLMSSALMKVVQDDQNNR
jgi:voltage-gated potassium channel